MMTEGRSNLADPETTPDTMARKRLPALRKPPPPPPDAGPGTWLYDKETDSFTWVPNRTNWRKLRIPPRKKRPSREEHDRWLEQRRREKRREKAARSARNKAEVQRRMRANILSRRPDGPPIPVDLRRGLVAPWVVPSLSPTGLRIRPPKPAPPPPDTGEG